MFKPRFRIKRRESKTVDNYDVYILEKKGFWFWEWIFIDCSVDLDKLIEKEIKLRDQTENKEVVIYDSKKRKRE